jgi:hypothetical protein
MAAVTTLSRTDYMAQAGINIDEYWNEENKNRAIVHEIEIISAL